MGKALAILGLLLIIVGLIPVLVAALGLTGLGTITDYFYMLNIYSIFLGGYEFSELMLVLIGLGFILLIVGAIK